MVLQQQEWNQYDRTVAGRDRTSNHAEAAHRKMFTELGVSHLIIWKFIDGLKKIKKAEMYSHTMNNWLLAMFQDKNSLNM